MSTLSPIEQRIYYLVKRAGPNGISGDDLFGEVYNEMSAFTPWAHKSRHRNTLKAHVYQINRKLKDSRIVGDRCPGGWYRLVHHIRPFLPPPPRTANARSPSH